MAELYQLRVVLRDVSPLVWRRLLISSETRIAQLYDIFQLAFDWSALTHSATSFTVHFIPLGYPTPQLCMLSLRNAVAQ